MFISIDDTFICIGGLGDFTNLNAGLNPENYLSTVYFKSINNTKTCHIQPLDHGLTLHASVVSPIGVITCGGVTPNMRETNKCDRLKNKNTWEPFPSMNEARFDFDMVIVGETLISFGGYSDEDTYEKINWRNGDKWELVKMNRKFSYTCVTYWDEESILITGGKINGFIKMKLGS